MKNLKHFGKRGLAVLIALVMCLSLLPMSAFAANTDWLPNYTWQQVNGMYDGLWGEGNSAPTYNAPRPITKAIGENGSYLRVPHITLKGQYCGHIIHQQTPEGYCQVSHNVTQEGILTNVTYTMAAWPEAGDFYGDDGVQMNFTAAKPGSTTVTLTYYVNYVLFADIHRMIRIFIGTNILMYLPLILLPFIS